MRATFLVLFIAACATTTATPPPAPARLDEVPSLSTSGDEAQSRVLTIVGTADLHGHLERLPLLAGYVEAIRAQNPVVLIDGGDMWQGTLASNMNEGAAGVSSYGVLRYDAATIGNHEFDYGPIGASATVSAEGDQPRSALYARAQEASFPLLAANIRTVSGEPIDWPSIRPSTVIRRAGVDVGIVGITTASTLETTIAANVSDLAIEPLAESVLREATRLRAEGAELVVVAAHAGGECTDFADPDDLSSCDESSEIFELARALPAGLVDVIVAGHTHKAIAHRVNGVAIISSWALGTHFGRVDIHLDGDSIEEVRIHPPTELCDTPPCEYGGLSAVPDPATAAAVAPALQAAESRLAEELGPTFDEAFARSYDAESAAGNLLVDGLAELREGVDVVLLNAGGVRADFPAGPLTYGDLYEVFPFDNRFALVELSAEQLAAIVSHNAAASGGILILGKVRAELSCRRGLQVRLIDSRGRTIPPSRRLRVLTSDYLATTSVFAALPEGAVQVEQSGPLMREALADWFREQGSRHFVPAAHHDAGTPRIALPSERPVRCAR